LLTAGADALVGLAVLAETAVLWIEVRWGSLVGRRRMGGGPVGL
jgi:hypothetical protein